MKKFFKHLHMVNKHRFKVFIHCCKCGLFWRGLVHDLSKYSFTEFWEGVKYYNGKHSPIEECRKKEGFSKAWLHHKGRNKHHIEYWYDSDLTVQPLIPYKYAVECVCDKLSAAKCYNKSDYTVDKCLAHWLKWGQKVEMNPKMKDFFTQVFTDLSNLGEKAILNKKYMKRTYNKIVLEKP